MKPMPEFPTYQEREAWLKANADHFVIVRRANRHNYRAKVSSFEKALELGTVLVAAHPSLRLLIYAVYGSSDCWVHTISHDNIIGGSDERSHTPV